VPRLRRRVEPAVRPDAGADRGGQHLARRQRPHHAVGAESRGDDDAVRGRALDGEPPAPAPRERAAEDLAVRRARGAVVDHHPRVGVVAGDPATAGQHRLPERRRGPVQPRFGGPPPAHLTQPVVGHRRQRPGRRVGSQNADRRIRVRAGVPQDQTPLDHRTTPASPVAAFHSQWIVAVGEAQNELRRFARVLDRRRDEFELQLAGTIRETHGELGMPELECRTGRQFQRTLDILLEGPRATVPDCPECRRRHAGRNRHRDPHQGSRLLQPQFTSPMRRQQAVPIVQPQHRTRLAGGQYPGPSS